MFLVTCISPLDEVWEDRDILIHKAAGRKSDASGAGHDGINPPFRDHCWYTPTFDEALEMKKHLSLVVKTRTTIREHSSYAIAMGPIN